MQRSDIDPDLLQAGLQWEVRHVLNAGSTLEITSDPWEHTHTIQWPDRGDDVREIEFLHELAHAWLAENVHHLLATAMFKPGIPDEDVEPFVWPKRTAADWFADAVLWKWRPREAAAEILEHLEYVRGIIDAVDPFIMFTGGLIFAQAVHWKLITGKMPALQDVPELFRPVASVLLKFAPEKPSVGKMRDLINKLAGLTTNTKRLRLFNENGIEVWEIYEP